MRCLLPLLLSSVCTKAQSPSAAKARAMLEKMSLDEKISMLHGGKTSYTGGTPEILNATTGVRYCDILCKDTDCNERLTELLRILDDRIPPLNLNDGPQGYRSGGTTCWPSAMTVGATFDVALALKWGQAMGKEFFDKASICSIFVARSYGWLFFSDHIFPKSRVPMCNWVRVCA